MSELKDIKDLDLLTLEYIKYTCDLYSDMSSRTHGYNRLCELIKEVKQANGVGQSKQLPCDRCENGLIWSKDRLKAKTCDCGK